LPVGLNINPTHGSYGSGSERPWKAKSARSCWPWNKPPPTCWGPRVFLQKLGVGRSFWNMTPVRAGCKFVCFFSTCLFFSCSALTVGTCYYVRDDRWTWTIGCLNEAKRGKMDVYRMRRSCASHCPCMQSVGVQMLRVCRSVQTNSKQ